MICPYCGYDDQLVVNKRSTNSATKNWRRRRCTKCFKVFTTYEAINLDYIIVTKKSGKKVRFKREKMYASIYNAFIRNKNVDNGDCASKAEKMSQLIEKELVTQQVKEISTENLRLLILREISKKDFPVTLNYISYFIHPKNIEELNRVMKNILKTIHESYK